VGERGESDGGGVFLVEFNLEAEKDVEVKESRVCESEGGRSGGSETDELQPIFSEGSLKKREERKEKIGILRVGMYGDI
jgi:hypothetical protein